MGSLLGFSLVLFSIQLFSDFRFLLSNQTDLVQSQYTVINKEVGMLNTFSIGSTHFSEAEINDLKKQSFIERVGVFTPNAFSASASFDLNENGNGVYMDLFFEAVSDEFLDTKPDDWNWHEDDEVIPMILPTDFINMYNFNYAPGRGMPQLSKNTIGMISFNVQLRGANGKTYNHKGRVSGFSDRIASVLVPKKFIDFANQHYAQAAEVNPYRLIVKARNDQMGHLAEYINKKGYETNSENLRSGKFNSLIYQSLNVLGILGLLVILVSLVGFIQFSQLLVNKSQYEIETLNRLGFSYKIPARFYMSFYIIVYLFILILSAICIYISKIFLADWLSLHGIEISSGIAPLTLIGGVLLIVLLILGNYITLHKQLRGIIRIVG
jgi:hypothetical protein